jgi:hypothetical protein
MLQTRCFNISLETLHPLCVPKPVFHSDFLIARNAMNPSLLRKMALFSFQVLL